MSALRVLLVLAASLLVAAVALGTLLPVDEPLSQVLADLAPTLLARLQALELRWFGDFAWRAMTVPLLVRPAWLPPLGLGVISGGAALSLAWAKATGPSAHRL